MDVKDMINLAASLSVGLDKPTLEDANIYLRYLNLVHFELYKSVAMFNPYIPVEKETMIITNGVGKFINTPFAIASVHYYEGNAVRILKKQSYDLILQSDPEERKAGLPLYWYYQNRSLNIYPKKTTHVGVVYIGEPKEFTLNTIEEEIPYPAIYHQVLVDGMSYYIYQGESGLKTENTAMQAFAKFEKGKHNLYAYLLSLSGASIGSTYSVV